MNFVFGFFITFILSFFLVPTVLLFLRTIGFYVIVQERQSVVVTLFGKVICVIDEPGVHWLWLKIGIHAVLVPWLGRKYTLDLRLDQEYLRSQPVNSEEGAPMGIGIWYEMVISDPVAYLFRNSDPRGSLRANVSNVTVRALSNMPLGSMLEDRHTMSQIVRTEVSEKSQEWGYKAGSVYIRKVHFRDEGMIRQIEEKVVNRLRQVTSAIMQDGANQVSIIKSTAERRAAVEFARAAAIRPQIVGAALQQISADSAVCAALFEILETQKLLKSKGELILLPEKGREELLPQLLAAESSPMRPRSEAEPEQGFMASRPPRLPTEPPAYPTT